MTILNCETIGSQQGPFTSLKAVKTIHFYDLPCALGIDL